MSDDRVRPVQAADIPAFERRAGDILDERRALYVTVNKGLLIDSIINKLLMLALAGIIFIMLPLKQWIPSIVGFDYTNGVHDWVRDASELPPDKYEDVTLSTLWAYIENCESYTFEGAPHRYAICSALSADKALTEYQTWFQHDTATSPQYTMRDGHVTVEELPNSAHIKDSLVACRKSEFCEAEISYSRIEQRKGQSMSKRHYTESLYFVFVDNLPAGQVQQFNPAALKVIAFHKNCDDCGRAGT